MKLEVGMHAYSKTCRHYGIGKIVYITENGQGFRGDLIDIQYKYSKHAIENQDVFASHNIIDLIEEGDYVNGERVIALEKDIDIRNIYPTNIGAKIFTDYELQGDWYFGIQEKDIKDIVTKEQFDSMKYEVDSNE